MKGAGGPDPGSEPNVHTETNAGETQTRGQLANAHGGSWGSVAAESQTFC